MHKVSALLEDFDMDFFINIFKFIIILFLNNLELVSEYEIHICIQMRLEIHKTF